MCFNLCHKKTKTDKMVKQKPSKPEVKKPEFIKPAVPGENAHSASLQANQNVPLKEENKTSALLYSKLVNIRNKDGVTSNTSLFLLKPDYKKAGGTLYKVDCDVFEKERERLYGDTTDTSMCDLSDSFFGWFLLI